jgi:hypothetical protein
VRRQKNERRIDRFIIRPIPISRQSSDDPPIAEERQGDPDHGQQAGRHPTLMTADQKTVHVSPSAIRHPKRSRARPAMITPRRQSAQIERDQRDGADETPLLRPHREDEVGVLLGQEVQVVLRALQKALSQSMPEPTAIFDWSRDSPLPADRARD